MKKIIIPNQSKLIAQVGKFKTVNRLGYYIAFGLLGIVVSAFVFAEMSNKVASQDESSIFNQNKKPKLHLINDYSEDIKPKDIAIKIDPLALPDLSYHPSNTSNTTVQKANQQDDYVNQVLAQEAQERAALANQNANTSKAANKGNMDVTLTSKHQDTAMQSFTSNNAGMPDLSALANLQNTMQMPNMANIPNMPEMMGASNDQNLQAKKEKFMSKNGQFDYLDNELQAARHQKEIKAGTIIPAILANSINSDLPNIINAIVSEDVYDSISHSHIIIPKGTKLNGIYDSNLSFGQDGLAVVWNRLVFSDGSTFNIGSMAGADQSGSSGFRDKVNNHYARTFGSSVLIALIGSGMQLSQPKGKTSTANDAQETITANMAQQTGNTAQGVLNKMLNVQPTITINAGYRFNVMVNKDFIIGS